MSLLTNSATARTTSTLTRGPQNHRVPQNHPQIEYIFQLPLSCRLQKYPHFDYLVKTRLRYLQITTGWSFSKLTFLFFDESSAWAVMSTNEQSWALMSAHGDLCALRINWEYVVMVLWVLLSSYECSRVLTLPLHQAHECLWLHNIAYKHSRVLMTAN